MMPPRLLIARKSKFLLPLALVYFSILLFAAGSASNSAETSAENKSSEPLHIDPNKVVDLTHELAQGMPDFHGDEHAFKYQQTYSIAKDGYANGTFSMPEHLGTHIDAPSHFMQGGTSIDKIPAAKLILPCVVIDVRKEVEDDPDYCLTLDKVKAFEKNSEIPGGAAVLLLTGWSKRWDNPVSYRNLDKNGTMHFPGFSFEAAEYLANQKHASCLGIDTLSLDPGNSAKFPVHNHELPRGLFFIENLTALDKIPAQGALIICAPLRIKDGTGSPARILAVLP
jgi:kynurenine formamidase